MEACPSLDQLRQWLAGLASDADSVLIEKHIATCTNVCQPRLDSLSGFEDDPHDAARQRQPSDETAVALDHGSRTPATAEPRSTTPGVPRKFGRFEIIELLGKGGFGAVYRAHDPQLDRDVALKIPNKGLLENEEHRKRFLREARTAASLNTPHICPVYEAAEWNGRQYIVMGLVDGQPLAAIIARGRPLAERAAASTARKLALALDEAHRAGIVHRDLKPTNIMIDRRGQPVVMDFGLARRYDPNEATLTQVGAVLGTPAYMAPEQALSRLDQIGPATDIYAMGIVLYEMLTLRRPFAGGAAAVLGQVVEVQPKPPSAFRPGLDPRLDAICLKAIAKDPSDRYHSMRELAEALSDYLKAADTTQADAALIETQQFTALVSGLDTRLSDIAKRQRLAWWQWTAAGIVVVSMVLLGWLLLPRAPATVTVRIGIDPALLADASLSYFLDQREITAQQAADKLPLPVGDHDLLIKRAETLIKHYRFHVSATAGAPANGSPNADSETSRVVLTEVDDRSGNDVEMPAPVAYWGFDGDAPAVPAEGGIRRAVGVAGSVAAFSAPDDAIVVPDEPRFHATNAVTVAAWVCPRSERAGRIAGKWSDKDAYVLSWAEGFYWFRVAFPVGDAKGTAVGVHAFGAARNWAHVVGVYDGERLRLYVDGQLTNSQPLLRSAALRKTPEFARDGRIPTALQESDRPFELGADGFDGLVDEVKVWDSALSNEQVAVLFASYDSPAPLRESKLSLLVPAYFYPAAEGRKEWDRLIAAAADIPVAAIANPASGPGKSVDPNYTNVIRECKQAGAQVIGYVRTDFGKRPATEVTADVDQWLRFYPDIRGFFFDEQASGPKEVEHYAEIYRYAKGKLAAGIIVANAGTPCDRGYFERSAADIICIYDNRTGFETFKSRTGLGDVAAGRLAGLLYDVSDDEQMKGICQRAAAEGLTYLYVTDDTNPNPWDRLPSYWEAEFSVFRQ